MVETGYRLKAKLGILTTHPIQYYAPLFRHLSGVEGLESTVYYCLKPTSEQQGTGFGIPFEWDLDLVSGYNSKWLKNESRCPDLQRFSGCDTPGIADIIERERFDAFLTIGWYTKSMWQAIRACWRSGTPLLVRGDSHLYGDSAWPAKIIKRIAYPWFMKRFFACLAVGKWSEEYFSHYGARRIIKSPHFVDNSWFAERCARAVPHAARIREDLGIPARSFVFLFVGKFEEKKRPLDMLHALKGLRDSGSGGCAVHLLMVGDGVLRGKCQEYALRHSLPAAFAGFMNQAEMPKAYGISDVLVLPSDGRETWGLVINEAMACGLPAIVSDRVGCWPDLIKEGETGYVYGCSDIAALSARMNGMIHRDDIASMGARAQAHVANFTVDRAAEGILKAIEMAKHHA